MLYECILYEYIVGSISINYFTTIDRSSCTEMNLLKKKRHLKNLLQTNSLLFCNLSITNCGYIQNCIDYVFFSVNINHDDCRHYYIKQLFLTLEDSTMYDPEYPYENLLVYYVHEVSLTIANSIKKHNINVFSGIEALQFPLYSLINQLIVRRSYILTFPLKN